MDWKFWQKNKTEAPHISKTKKIGKPRELPQDVGRHLVVVNGLDPDWVGSLKCVEKPRENAKDTFDFRIFSAPSAARDGLTIMDYHSLDHHMNLVLFAGWYSKDTHGVELEPMIKQAV